MRRPNLFAVMASLALALGQASPAYAENDAPEWVKSPTSNKAGTDFVDINSIKRDGDLAQIRIRTEFAPGQSSLKTGEGLLEVNCKANKARILSMDLVTSEGEAIAVKRAGEWQDIAEGSPAANAANFACREAGASTPAQPRG